MTTRLTLLGLILTTFTGFPSAFGAEGGSADGGGGFQFYRAKLAPLLKSAERELYHSLNNTPEEFFKEAFAPYEVNKAELIEIIRARIVHNLEAPPRSRKTPTGETDVLMLDFTLNAQGEKQIEVLLPWYEEAKAFLARAKPSEYGVRDEYLMQEHKRALLHESLHHYGIINDDLAFKYSLNVKYLGGFAQRQIDACKTAQAQNPKAVCLKAWTAGYQYASNEVRNWFAGFEGKGQYRLYQSIGSSLAVNLAKPKYLSIRRMQSEVEIISKCIRENSILRVCDPKYGNLNGQKVKLSRLNDRAFYIGFSVEPHGDEIKVDDIFLSKWPELMWLAAPTVADETFKDALVIVKENQ